MYRGQFGKLNNYKTLKYNNRESMRQREMAELDLSQYYQVRANCSSSMNSEAHVRHMLSFNVGPSPIFFP